MKKTELALLLSAALLIALSSEIVTVEEAKANFVPPPPDTIMIIETPKNSTYKENTITFNITIETNLYFNFYYSLDNQELKRIENITIVSEELLPDWANWWDGRTPIYRKTIKGNYTLCNLSEGWHNTTIYQIRDKTILCSDSVLFLVDAHLLEPLQILTVMALSSVIAIVTMALFTYFKKFRKKNKIDEKTTSAPTFLLFLLIVVLTVATPQVHAFSSFRACYRPT